MSNVINISNKIQFKFIIGATFNRLGLWHHCFRSLADPNDENNRRFFAGCRWIYDPFTTGYDQIRGFLVPSKYLLSIVCGRIILLVLCDYLKSMPFDLKECFSKK